ncbi:MAG: ZIP family metal transporter [Flavobacteriales bacterium]
MLIYIIGLCASFAAGAWFILKPPAEKKWIFLFLSAGGAFLMTVIFTHILPEIFEVIPTTAGFALLAGFLIQILLENYSKGIEHGHAHSTTSRRKLFISYAALCLHALIEGMPLASAIDGIGTAFSSQLALGIMLHKIPVAITLSVLLSNSGVSKNQAMIWLLGFILCTVVGSGVQYSIGESMGERATELMFVSLGLTVGILLHVSTTILYESSDHHKLSPSRVLAILAGVAIALLS